MVRSTILVSEFGEGSSYLHVSVQPPFLHQAPRKNEVPSVPIHPKKSTQHQICPFYRPSQQSTDILPIMYIYVRQLCHRKLTCFRLDNTNKHSPCFHYYSAAGTDAKYESAQTILSMLSHVSTSALSTFVS